MIHIDPRDATPIYRQVIDQVRQQVITGVLQPGEQIESVANLARREGINPMTISKAYSVLVDAGVLERRRGVGMFVAPVPSDEAAAARRALLDGALRDAATLVVQLEIPAAEAAQRLVSHITEITRQEEGNHE